MPFPSPNSQGQIPSLYLSKMSIFVISELNLSSLFLTGLSSTKICELNMINLLKRLTLQNRMMMPNLLEFVHQTDKEKQSSVHVWKVYETIIMSKSKPLMRRIMLDKNYTFVLLTVLK